MTDSTKETASYEEAIAEIEDILEAIENDSLPIDALAPKVERAAELLESCKALLGQTEIRVAKAIDALREPEAAPEFDE